MDHVRQTIPVRIPVRKRGEFRFRTRTSMKKMGEKNSLGKPYINSNKNNGEEIQILKVLTSLLLLIFYLKFLNKQS